MSPRKNIWSMTHSLTDYLFTFNKHKFSEKSENNLSARGKDIIWIFQNENIFIL